MGFIKHAIIGIALYEAVKYVLKKRDCGFEFADNGRQGSSAAQQLRREEVDVVAGARQTDQLNRMKENANPGGHGTNSSEGLTGLPGMTQLDVDEGLARGTDPETPLTGKDSDEADPWKKSLANDELRAPDS
jgi:hypothetical protein